MTTELKVGIRKLTAAEHNNPFEILGMHKIKNKTKEKAYIIRAYEPGATEIFIINPQNPQKPCPMTKSSYEPYFFEFQTSEKLEIYKFKAIYKDGNTREYYDPYFFPSLLTDYDLYLFGEGNNHHIYEKIGAHLVEIKGVTGCYFSVWAPNAKKVSIIGEFNNWDGRRHQMRHLGDSGVWDLFIPELKEGDIYKYEIKDMENNIYEKSDPYAFATEMRPKTACVITDLSTYKWSDTKWLQQRKQKNPLTEPISVYEVHLGSWMRCVEEGNRFLTYKELAPKLAKYVKEMGYTHIELMPVAEHPLDDSWGYQVINYFAPTSRFGTPQEFMYFVDHMHQEGIGVLMDWVPAHFPKDGHGLAYFDGTHLYEHQDPRKREHRDWGTLIFNYGRNEVRNFLISNALFWLDVYHLDGLRVDAVASMLYLDYSKSEGDWVPNHLGGNENFEAIYFLKRTNELVFSYYPGVMMIAEESTAWGGVSKPTYMGGLGFNMKWNMGWMNDILTYMEKDPVHRKYHQNQLTFALLYAFHENFVLSLSHDEVVHGKRSLLDKMPGNMEEKFANLRALYGFMYGHPGKKLNFMGSEFGQWNEWDCNKSIDWHLTQYEPHQKLMQYVKDLNNLYKQESPLWENDYDWTGFEWIDFADYDNCIISFIRWSHHFKESLIFVCNFTPVVRKNYKIGVPFKGYYQEILNSDSAVYGGSNIGNAGGATAVKHDWQNREYYLELTLPPLSVLILKPQG